MKKRERRKNSEPEQPLSAGRVEYLEAARARERARSIRRAVIIVAVLAAVVAFATGFVGESVALAKDMVDSAVIALEPSAGWPQNTGVMDVLQAEAISGGFVVLGDESCAVYSSGGNRLNSVQSGYARPALAVGKTRFVVYNRSGTELRVESRTQNLYTKTTENSIYLCALAADGKLGVVTDSTRSAAELTVYSASMDELLTWELTGSEGVPLRLEFAPDSRRVAAAAVTASGGEVVTNLYVLSLSSGDPVLVGTQSGVPQSLEWLSSDLLLCVYDSRAVLYSAAGGERAAYDFGTSTLESVSVDTSGNIALLLSAGQTSEVVAFDRSLSVQYTSAVPASNAIVRSGSVFYLLTDSGIECFDLNAGWQWSQALSAKPQAALPGQNGTLLVFSGNTVQQVAEPESEES